MYLKISHRTEYSYDVTLSYALQRLRLIPRSGPTQAVLSWSLKLEGAKEEVGFTDHFGNENRLVSIDGNTQLVVVEASGSVQTSNKAGVTGAHYGFAPLWLFERETPLTEGGELVASLAASVSDGSDIARLHTLMGTIAEKVAYKTGSTDATTTAEQALGRGEGVCQDHAHIFISAARLMKFPARYVSGYLLMDGTTEQAASHAWAEAYVDSLGWVAFDAANGISPDERYVRIATGRDYREAAPVSGIRLGQAAEELAVWITVEQ
ncbi:transglutaminase family protein [Mesorhizobium sp. SB112]|uniref:transglutaminase family protein n=1 Tax=Mesorhizobium sp. SB112 TaxID=3151853 RepID=UPI0032639E87